jgi:hypothetical protein
MSGSYLIFRVSNPCTPRNGPISPGLLGATVDPLLHPIPHCRDVSQAVPHRRLQVGQRLKAIKLASIEAL